MLLAVLDCLGDPAVALDPTGRLRHANRAAQEVLGGRAESGEAEDLLAAVAPDFADAVRATVLMALADEGCWRGTVELTDCAGRRSGYSCLVVADREGYVVLARSDSEARAREALERELAASNEFFAKLGHELRTPLNAALGFAQLLELEDLPADQRADVERILTAGRHMQALLDEVLDLARVRTGGIDLDVGPVPVLEVVRGVVELVEPLASKRAIRRRVDPAEEAVALADRRRLWQVLLNLVGNAVKYGREGGNVRVGVTVVGPDRLRIEVEDDGPGIEPRHLDRLFRPFERLGQERSGVEGTGLGLAMSYALVQAMEGTLSATSEVGRGTVFTVELPAVAERELAELAAEAEQATAEPVIVHVGADPAAQALVEAALRRLGARVVAVDRAAVALDAVRRNQPTVIILDAELPDAYGSELLHRLAADPLSALVPKVVLSTEVDPRVHLRLRAAGARHVLGLPLDVRQLIDTVSRLVDRARR